MAFLPPLSNNAMSELDAFSDSDWLDISSGRDSDDNDSLSDQDSDRDEISSASRSRRSSISNESSMGGDVEAWEGFVSDSGDEAAETLTGMYPVPLPSAPGAEPIAAEFVPMSAGTVDPAQAEEDQRVREALDQSFVGTLNASRSSAGHPSSTHTSIRDLRLSFPDPLTSSRDELSQSYEAVSSPRESMDSSSTDDESTDSSPTDNDVDDTIATELAAPMPIPPAYPRLLSTTPEVQSLEDAADQLESEDKTELDIILYGCSSEVKWKFVQELIQKATLASGHACTDVLHEGGQVQTLRLVKRSANAATFFDIINVYDCTNDSLVKHEVDTFYTSDRLSLALVFLPTAQLPVLRWHSAFLPVQVPSSLDGDSSVLCQLAEDDWDLLRVPPQKTLKIGTSESSVFDSQQLVDIKPLHVYQALCDVGHDNTKKDKALKPLTEQIKSVNAVTIFALMSIVMGFAFNTVFKPSTPAPTPTINTPSPSNGHLLGIFAPQPNRSLVGSSTAYSNVKGNVNGPDVLTGPFSSVALSVYDGHTTSISMTSPQSSMSVVVASTSKAVAEVTTTSPLAKCNQCDRSAASDKARASTDMVVRSATATALAELPQVKSSLSIIASHTKAGASGSSIVLNGLPKSTIATAAKVNLNSVSEVFDATTKALTEAMSSDLSEIVGVADELFSSFLEQTDNIVRQSKGKARALGEQVQNFGEKVGARHERAKQHARELSTMGKEIVRGASEVVVEGTVRAQRRAKELKKTVVDGGNEARKRAKELKSGLKKTVVESGNEVLKNYGKAHEEWDRVLRGKAVKRQEQREMKQERREGREARKTARAEKENTARRRFEEPERLSWRRYGGRRDTV